MGVPSILWVQSIQSAAQALEIRGFQEDARWLHELGYAIHKSLNIRVKTAPLPVSEEPSLLEDEHHLESALCAFKLKEYSKVPLILKALHQQDHPVGLALQYHATGCDHGAVGHRGRAAPVRN